MSKCKSTNESFIQLDGNIGIWWLFSNGEVNGYMCSLDDGYVYEDGIISRSPMECDQTLLNTLSKLPRGRVIYDSNSQAYMIVCNDDVAINDDAISKIVDMFNLHNDRYEVMSSPLYYTCCHG